MSYLFDNLNDHLDGSFTSTYADPITIAAFIKIADHPVAAGAIVNFGNSSSSATGSYLLRAEAVDNDWGLRSIDDAAGATSATKVLNIDGVWAGIVGVITNDSLRDIYVQSIGNTGQNTTTRSVANALQFIRVGETLAAASDFTNARIAEIAIWNAALDSSQITSYLGGLAASQIASANLIGYWPLSSDNATQANQGTDAGGDLTVTGAAFDSDHPTITTGTAPSLYVVRSSIRLN